MVTYNSELSKCQIVLKWTLCVLLISRLSNLNSISSSVIFSDFSSAPQTLYNGARPVFVQTPESPCNWPALQSHLFVWLRNIRHKLLKNVPLSSDRKTHRMTLLLISGLHPNPGPRRPKYPCGVCSYACKTGVLACDDCDQWLHKECVGMSTSLFMRLGDSSDPWTCPSCSCKNKSTKVYMLSSQNEASQSSSDSPPCSHCPPTTPTDSSALSSSLESSVAGTSTSSTSQASHQSQTVHSLSETDTPPRTSSPKTAANKDQLRPKKSLRILNINFNSARKKGKLLEAIIDDTDPDIILGTETWLDEKLGTAEILPSYLGYDVHRHDRSTDPHGGVLIAAKRELQLSDITRSKETEMISGSVQLSKRKKLIVAAFYRPPIRTDEAYTTAATTEFFTLKDKAGKNILIIGGDYNLPDIDWEDTSIVRHQYPERMNRAYLDAVADTGMEQLVDFPTRKDVTLDLIVTTHPSLKQRCKPLPSIGNSDHDIVLFDCALSPFRPRATRRKIFLWKRADTDGIKQDLADFNDTFMTDPGDVHGLWASLKSKIQEVMEKRVPSKMSASRHSHPWMNTTIRRSIRRKQRAHRKARRTGKKRDMDRYKSMQQEVKFHVRQAHRQYMEDIISDDFTNNSKKFWAYVKSKGQDSAGVAPLKNTDGFLQSNSAKKAEILNEQFRTAFTTEDTSCIPDKGDSPFPAMDDIQVGEGGVRKLLRNLQTAKATGPDSIPAFILKTAADELAPILTRLFQLSLDSGEVPTDWRHAWVVPIFKKGERHLAANYRPVSLTSITSKILEHIIHSSVMKHFDHHNILTDSQHGFRQKRSCETQLIMTVHEIAQQLAQGAQVDVILLDFSKAFDKVPHARLLHKLDYYGVRNNTLKWIAAFLSYRQQQVALEGNLSSPVDVVSGVPQGTVLGPLLFLTFINDLPDCVKFSTTKLFADDCLLVKRIASQNDSLQLQQDLSALEHWETTWQMEFNPSKCNVIRIAPDKKKVVLPTSYSLHGQNLETTASSKYLGVAITEDLSWKKHIESTINKGNRAVGFLRRNFRECTTDVKAATYKTMVRPVVEYASTVWDPTCQEDISALEKVQRRAARYVFNNYSDRTPGCVTSMLNTLQWEPLADRRLNNRLSMLYKINSGIVDLNKTQLYTTGDSRTRGAQRLFQERITHPVLFNSFIPRTLRQWNGLPTRLTEAPSLESFQAGLGRRTGPALLQ